ncbi:hypothetical protein MG293_020886 [Ovis ammon polii]|uniref:GB1/RHD3-type G domain-containing protein n=1 Tax=Ovis ammon polii TaxID=230172 RepID=A0AAD4TJQ5_OVIAM|nr:hypothetical protein MG293_020886 [Ovis ammon polii]
MEVLHVPMASGSTKMDPICLVENRKNQLSVNAKALKILEQISQHLVVVAVVGLYQTGKSYLMNRLAGQNHGFRLGSTVRSETKGIWMWCVPHPSKENHTLVLLDTEGLGNVEKIMIMKEKDDFLLQNEEASVRYCQAELRKLSEPLATSISEGTFFVPGGHSLYLEARNKLEQDYKLVPRKGVKANQVLQSFLQSQAEVEAGILQADQALKNADKAVAEKRTKRQAAEMKQDLLTQELNDKKQKLEAQERSHQKNIGQLKEKFKMERENLLREQEAVLAQKLKCYVSCQNQTIFLPAVLVGHCCKRSGNTLDMASEIHMPAPKCLIENTNGQLLANPEALKILSAIREPVVVVAIVGPYRTGKSYLMNKLARKKKGFSLGSTVQSHTKGIWMWCMPHPKKPDHTLVLLDTEGLGDVEKDKLKEKLDDFCKQNTKASSDYCMALIQDIFHPLYEDVKQGTFSKPGGYYLFIKKMNELKDKYHQVPRKGVQTGETLRKYLDSKEGVVDALRQTDQSLTEKEKEIEVERMKSESAEAANKMLEGTQKKNEQMMKEKEASYQEHVKQLTEKMEKERAQLIADQERVLALKLQVPMASGSTKMDPICLVENRKNQLSVNAKALKILEQISQRLVVVAVVGLYRTGKSYLMNRLAGQNHGFCLGSTVRSETKGIWMWCVPHPSKENHTLVLLDTEGLGNVEKEDSKNDLWIFALAVLLSSTFIYNSMNSINHQALQQLQYPFKN